MDGSNDKYSLFRRGADDGVPFGCYLVILFTLLTFGIKVPLLSLPAMLMIIGVPLWTYRRLRKTYVDEHGMTKFSALWMQGIVMFFCGGLLMALAAYIYMAYITPTFIVDQMKFVADTYSGTEIGATMETALKNKIIPTPIQSAMEMLWMSVFSGSILSILMALLVQARRVPDRNRRRS